MPSLIFRNCAFRRAIRTTMKLWCPPPSARVSTRSCLAKHWQSWCRKRWKWASFWTFMWGFFEGYFLENICLLTHSADVDHHQDLFGVMPLATWVMKVQNVLVSTTSWGEISLLHHVHRLTGLSAWETVFQEGANSWVLYNDLHLLSRAVTLTHCASTLSTLFNIISLKSLPTNNTLAEWNVTHGESNLSTVLMTLSLSANRSQMKSNWIKTHSRSNTHTQESQGLDVIKLEVVTAS